MKRLLKLFVRGIALVAVAPALIGYWVTSCVIGKQKAFPGFSQGLSLIPGLTGQYLRHAFYSAVLKRIGKDSCLTFGTLFSDPAAELGDNVYVGAFCSIGDVTIESDVLIASHVSIMNGSQQHGTDRLDIPISQQPGKFEHITIGTGSWIGERALIAANVGQHCIIGAGAVVTKPIPDYAIAVGVPAKVVRFRNEEATVNAPESNYEKNPTVDCMMRS
jgi:virginiamycin A acetyltransferase